MVVFGVFGLGILFHIIQAIPAPGHGVLTGYCVTSADCQIDECCVSFIQPRGKRLWLDDLPPELMRLVKGRCVKRGLDKPADYCILNGAMPAQKDLFYHCPCMDGYTCEGTGRIALPDGEIGTCRKTTKRAVRDCYDGSDCHRDECCVSDMRQIGKRSLNYEKKAIRGHCHPMGHIGDSCLVRMGSGRPNDTAFACPCLAGTTCVGIGVYDVPLGEMGKCQ